MYDALLRDNVSLMTDGIERITPKGIVTGGVEHELDIIAFATGFKANDYLWPMEVRGRGGVRIEEVWAKDGPRAYLGAMVAGFPTCSCVTDRIPTISAGLPWSICSNWSRNSRCAAFRG